MNRKDVKGDICHFFFTILTKFRAEALTKSRETPLKIGVINTRGLQIMIKKRTAFIAKVTSQFKAQSTISQISGQPTVRIENVGDTLVPRAGFEIGIPVLWGYFDVLA